MLEVMRFLQIFCENIIMFKIQPTLTLDYKILSSFDEVSIYNVLH